MMIMMVMVVVVLVMRPTEVMSYCRLSGYDLFARNDVSGVWLNRILAMIMIFIRAMTTRMAMTMMTLSSTTSLH